MSYRSFVNSIAILILSGIFAINANAAIINPPLFDFVFNFTGECDDCAFNGNPTDVGFNPLNDGLTETVTATLILNDVTVTPDGIIQYLGRDGTSFTYHGSSLINPFTINEPFLFTPFLLPSGQVLDGSEFTYASSGNGLLPEPDNVFNFPNFCTDLGRQVLGNDRVVNIGGTPVGVEENVACDNIGLVYFNLDSAGNFSIEGSIAFDVGTNGQLTPAATIPEPAAIWLFGIGLIGLVGVARRKNVA